MKEKQSKSKLKIIVPATLGNLLEWYDFTLYAYFAPIFATLFFPAENRLLSMLNVYGLFAAAYLMRPIGALVFGYMGDLYGRKLSLTYSVILMGFSSLFLCLLPTYADWGIYAPICLILIRLLQGFAVGGEYSGATVYLIEFAPAKHRIFFGSLAVASAYCGFLLSSLVSSILSILMGPDTLSAWGWRLGFVMGAFLAMVGFYIRANLAETPVFKKETKNKVKIENPIKNLLYNHPLLLLLGIGISVVPAGLAYTIFVYLPNSLTLNGHYDLQTILIDNVIVMLFVVLSIPTIGYLMRYVDQHKFMTYTAVAIALLSIPLFYLFTYSHLLALLIFGLLNSMYEGNLPSKISTLFPPEFRYTGLALTLNLSFGIVGGFAPIIGSLLVYKTGLAVSPLFYVIGLAILSLISLISLHSLKLNGQH